MKTLIFSMYFFLLLSLLGVFFAFVIYQQHTQPDLRDLTIVLIAGIGLLLLVAGIIFMFYLTNWGMLKKELKQTEIDRLKTEYDMKSAFFKAQSEDNEKRRAFEARIQPQQLAEIMKAAKLVTKCTIENDGQPKEVKQTESFDKSLFDKAIDIIRSKE